MSNDFLFNFAARTSDPDALDTLSKSDDPYVLVNVATNRNSPGSVLFRIFDGEIRDSFLFSCLATNPNCPLEILDALSRYPDWFVREAVAENPSASEDLLERLSRDGDVNVRVAVAGNPSAPGWLLERLLGDVEYDVWASVKRHLAERKYRDEG